jgi:hypothetical protein
MGSRYRYLYHYLDPPSSQCIVLQLTIAQQCNFIGFYYCLTAGFQPCTSSDLQQSGEGPFRSGRCVRWRENKAAFPPRIFSDSPKL